MQDFKLYVILDVDVCASQGKIRQITAQIACAGADIVQLRAKNSAPRQILKIGRDIKRIVRKAKIRFLLNDRVELARIIDCDGVHLGQDDLPLKDTRQILGKDKIIGLSTHDLKQALKAEEQGADYIAIGPIFNTATKPEYPCLMPEIITEIKDRVGIPFLAIGGITLNNLAQLTSRGAQRVAVCRAILEAKDVVWATKEFKRRLKPLP